jgi:hypothetical protein
VVTLLGLCGFDVGVVDLELDDGWLPMSCAVAVAAGAMALLLLHQPRRLQFTMEALSALRIACGGTQGSRIAWLQHSPITFSRCPA